MAFYWKASFSAVKGTAADLNSLVKFIVFYLPDVVAGFLTALLAHISNSALCHFKLETQLKKLQA